MLPSSAIANSAAASASWGRPTPSRGPPSTACFRSSRNVRPPPEPDLFQKAPENGPRKSHKINGRTSAIRPFQKVWVGEQWPAFAPIHSRMGQAFPGRDWPIGAIVPIPGPLLPSDPNSLAGEHEQFVRRSVDLSPPARAETLPNDVADSALRFRPICVQRRIASVI